jgi:hypothetical protein
LWSRSISIDASSRAGSQRTRAIADLLICSYL